jgi:hypothetical protein
VILNQEKKWFPAALFFLFSIALGFSFYVFICLKSNYFTIDDHSFHPSALFLILMTAVFLIALVLLWRGMASFESRFFKKDFSFFLRKDLFAFVPLSLSLLSPFLLSHYLTAGDLKSRLKILAALMVFGFLLIKWIQLSRLDRMREFFEIIGGWFRVLSLKKKIFILFISSFLIYNLSSFVLIRNGRDFTGDEPYYLLTAHSLYEDRDINVANNYVNRDYYHFYSKGKYPDLKLGMYARPGKKGYQYIYPINLPGISVLMLPHYGLSRFFDGEVRMFVLSVSLSFWACLLGIQLFLFFQELWRKEKISLFFWFLYSFTVPVLFYSNHLYPEIVVAFFSFYVFRKVRSQKPMSSFQLVLCGIFLSSFFWFGLKYNMIFWPLLLVAVYFLLKDHKVRWRIVYFLVFPTLSMILFYYFVYSLYGTVNPISIYEGTMTPERLKAFKDLVLSIPVWLRIDSFFDYFLDQRDGLLLYAPFYFFFFTGIVEMFRHSKKDLIALLFISLPFLLNYAFLTHRQGFCPQGRILTPLSWILIVLVGYFFVYNRKKVYSWFFSIGCAFSFIIAVLLLFHPSFLYQSTTHIHTFRAGDLFLFLSSLNFSIPGFLPSFIKVNNLSYVPNYVWLGLILVFLLGYVFKRDRFLNKKIKAAPVFTILGFVFLFWWLALYPRAVLVQPQKADFPTGEKLTFYSLSRLVEMQKPGEFRIFQDNRSYRFFFTSWREIKKLQIGFQTLTGEKNVECRYFDSVIFKRRVSEQEKSVVLTDLPFYSYKNTHLYRLDIQVHRVSPEDSGTPFFLSVKAQY